MLLALPTNPKIKTEHLHDHQHKARTVGTPYFYGSLQGHDLIQNTAGTDIFSWFISYVCLSSRLHTQCTILGRNCL